MATSNTVWTESEWGGMVVGRGETETCNILGGLKMRSGRDSEGEL